MSRWPFRIALIAAVGVLLRLKMLLKGLSVVVGLIFLAFGVINILQPSLGLSFFSPIEKPRAKKDQAALNVLLAVAGAKNLFIGFAIISSVLYVRDLRFTGALIVASGCTAAIDGLACKLHLGRGQWDHWPHGVAITTLGVAVLALS